jgi:glutaredoxin
MSIVVHTKKDCFFCDKAKAFFKAKRLVFEEVYYDPSTPDYEPRKNALVGRTAHHTFPQIFIGDIFLGGFTQLTHAYDTLHLHELCASIGVELEMDF